MIVAESHLPSKIHSETLQILLWHSFSLILRSGIVRVDARKAANFAGLKCAFYAAEGRKLPIRNEKFREQSGALDGRRRKGKPATGTGGHGGPDCPGCSRSDLLELDPFVGPEAVAKFLDIDLEKAVHYARLGYLPSPSACVWQTDVLALSAFGGEYRDVVAD